jgi:hypothetical protein
MTASDRGAHMTTSPIGHGPRAIAAFCAITLLAGGCGTVVDPELSPDPTLAKAYSDAQTLPNAVALGESMRTQYAEKVEDQILLDRAVGLALIGAVSSVVGLGATGGPATAIIATSLGAGALFGADSFLSSKPLQFTYAAGANAVQCALDTMQPMIVAYGSRDRLKTLIDGTPDGTTQALSVKIGKAEQLMSGFSASAISPIYVRASAAVQSARSILDPARQALNAMNGSGGLLRSSLASIELQVTNAVINTTPSVSALAESLGVSLPAIGKAVNVPPVPTPTVKATPGIPALTANADEVELEKVTAELEQAVAEMTTIISAVNERPSADKLKNCNVDLGQAGLKMTVDPSGEVAVPAPSGATPNLVTIRASGGILPYRANWIGLTPPSDQVSMTVESGQGVVVVTVRKGAQEAAYGILIQDAANGSASTTIRVVASGGAVVRASAPAATCPKDPKVERVQRFLLDQRIDEVTNVMVNGEKKTLTADACYGEVTAAAIRTFLKKKNVADDEMPTDQQGLLDSMAGFLPPG